MNVGTILRAVQIYRTWGGLVTFEPGWETRGNGYTLTPVGVIVHHTATPSSIANPFPSRRVLRDGRSNLAGPLCNSAGPADGSVHIMAAQAANHAGASGGRSMGPLPVTTLFNPRVWGHEIDYAGTVPMLAGQYRAAVLWSAALLQAMTEAGLIPLAYVERVRAHAETSITGKFDPGYARDRTIDMRQFRAAVAAGPQPADDIKKEDAMRLALGRTPTDPTVWVGNGITRRRVEDSAELEGLRWWLTERFGQPAAEVETIDDLRVLGVETPSRADLGFARDQIRGDLAGLSDDEANIVTAVRAQPTGGQVDITDLAAALAPLIPVGTTPEQLASAVADEQDKRARDSDPGTGAVT